MRDFTQTIVFFLVNSLFFSVRDSVDSKAGFPHTDFATTVDTTGFCFRVSVTTIFRPQIPNRTLRFHLVQSLDFFRRLTL